MTYKVLARKWRPANFQQMVGQEHVLRALINALDGGSLHHAYLFTGTRGVGKTSVARILAKCLNCEVGVSATPCGVCAACTEISEGRFVDLIEVDAASRTKVEDTRELLENVQYAPSVGRFKIYLIDEVHMLSSHSFNALLKTLEEPPEHVKFLLATTDAQKLPATILSRCLQFSLKHLPPESIVEHLKTILASEAINYEDAALWLLAHAADGSMRDALSLTDQAIAFEDGDLGEQGVREMLGTVGNDALISLLQALSERNGQALLAQVDELASAGLDPESVLSELASALHRVALLQLVPDYRNSAEPQLDSLRVLAEKIAAEDVQLYYQIALQGVRDMPFAPSRKTGLEMSLLRMLAFLPEFESGVETEPARESEAAAAAATTKVAAPEAAEAPQAAAKTKSKPAPASRGEPARQSEKKNVKKAERPVAKASPCITRSEWQRIFEKLPLSGMSRNVASHCEVQSATPEGIKLTLDQINCQLFNETHVRQIREALEQITGTPLQLQLEPGTVSTETPYLRQQRLHSERQQQAIDSIMSDPNIMALQDTFDATVLEESISPCEENA